MVFQGPTPEFMEALRLKYSIMQQEANDKGGLQQAQTRSTDVNTELAPGLATAQIGKMGAEAGLDTARAGVAQETIKDMRISRDNPLYQMAQMAFLQQQNPALFGKLMVGGGSMAVGATPGAAPARPALPTFGGYTQSTPGIFQRDDAPAPSSSLDAAGAQRLKRQPDYWGLGANR